MFDDVKVVDGVVGGIDLAFNAIKRFAQAQLLPAGIPEMIECGGEIGGWVGLRERELPAVS
ncbi:MAG: hypothetical protein JWM99_1212 [Verrucomicrobiales bacterium]|nr:hypothetical protein [Verrucomicrobiales bacterium]